MNRKNYRITISIIAAVSLLLSTYLLGDNEFMLFAFFSNIYADFLIICVKPFFYFSDSVVLSLAENTIISSGKILSIGRFFFSLNQLAILFIVGIITQSTLKSKFLFLAESFLFVSIYNVLRIVVHGFLPETVSVHHWFFNIVLIPRWIIVIAMIYYFWEKNSAIKQYVVNKLKLSEEYYKSFFIKLVFANIVYYLVLIFTYNNLFWINGELFVKYILLISQEVLSIIGHVSTIDGRHIGGEFARLYMDDACIGINLMFLFAVFIALFPGKRIHKWWYIPTGLFVIILLNISRIVFIFIMLTRAQGYYKFPVDIHDVFTYPVLVFTFLMWVFWINKFAKK